MAVCETQVCEDSDPMDFHVPKYTLLPLFSAHKGLVLFIRSDVAYQCQQQLNTLDAEFSSFWVKFKIQGRILHFCFVYRRSNIERVRTSSTLETLSNSISSILARCPQSEIVVAGDFNVHNIDWLEFSSHTSSEGQDVELFAELNQLTQLVKDPTHISCVEGHSNNLLDLFLTSR